MTVRRQLPPYASQSVRADAFGQAVITVGPRYYGERWEIATVAIIMTGTFGADYAIQWRGYTGPAVPENLVLTSELGTNDSSSNDGIVLHSGEIFTSVWSNPSGLAGFPTNTLSLTGTQIQD